MSVQRLWDGAEGAAWARRLSGKTKICLIFFQAIYALSVDNTRSLLYGLLFCLLLHIAVRTPLERWYLLACMILLGLWGSMVSQSLFYAQPERTPLFTLISPSVPVVGTLTGGLTVYREGFSYGAIQGLRSASMLTMGLFVCWTSDPRQLLQALMGWRLPAQLSFMAVTALRFLPVLAVEAGEIITAFRLRSGAPYGRFSLLRNITKIVSPLLARSLRRAQVLSLSVLSRGFLEAKIAKGPVWPRWEKCFSLIVLFIGMGLFFAKVSYWCFEQGIYHENLRVVYDFAKLYL